MKKIIMGMVAVVKESRWQEKISFIFVWLYLCVLFILQSVSADVPISLTFWLFLCGLALAGTCCFWKFIGNKTMDFASSTQYSQKQSLYISIVVGVVTFLVFEGYLAGQYPGGMSPDTVSQYSQAMQEAPYNDWHPVLHTLLFFTLPLKTGHRLGFIVFMQLTYFSLAFSYLVYALCMNKCHKGTIIFISVFVWLNPFMAAYMMFPWKDIALTIFSTLLMGVYVMIVGSNGRWLHKGINLVFFSLTAVVCGYMRHNAVLFVGPMVLIVLACFLKEKKRRIIFLVCIGIFFVAVKGVYAGLKVEKPGLRHLETVALPMTIICNVMQKCPQNLPKKTQDLMYKVTSREIYENNYTVGSFNSVKYLPETDKEIIDAISYPDILKIVCQCFYYAPKESLEAFAKLTDMVWGITGKDGLVTPYIMENSWGIISNPKPVAKEFVNQIKIFFSYGIGRIIFGSFGLELLIMVMYAAYLFSKKRRSFIHMSPLFIYDFGTMLFLGTRDYRFFLLNLPLWIPVLYIMHMDKT